MSLTPGTPCSAASSGTVVSDSTSPGDRPRQPVWISTETGANSGNTSSFSCPSTCTPTNSTPTARAATRYRSRRLQPTSQRIVPRSPCSCFHSDAVLHAEQFLAADRDHDGAWREPGQVDLAALHARDADDRQRVGERPGDRVHDAAAVGLVEQGGVRDHGLAASRRQAVVPYSALLYQPNGSSVVYTVTGPLTYTLAIVSVASMQGSQVYLTGLTPGTVVVTVGGEELLGVQDGVGVET